MDNPLQGRSLVSMKDLNPDELKQVLETARRIKQDPAEVRQKFSGKTLAMIFQKPSLRTRVSFEAGMTQMGGHAIYLAPNDVSLGQRETTEDIARVLSRYVDIIMARTFGHDIVEDLAKYATVPVVNGLSDHEHPCQVLADLQAIQERKGRLANLHLVYCGDGNNVAHSLIYGGALTGMHVTIVCPPVYEPSAQVVAEGKELGKATGVNIVVTHDMESGVKGADVIYTDVWASMGKESEAQARKQVLAPYQVNADVIARAKPDCIVLHCLPAHYGDEITYDVARSQNSAIFDQAENRLHAQKALLSLLIGG